MSAVLKAVAIVVALEAGMAAAVGMTKVESETHEGHNSVQKSRMFRHEVVAESHDGSRSNLTHQKRKTNASNATVALAVDASAAQDAVASDPAKVDSEKDKKKVAPWRKIKNAANKEDLVLQNLASLINEVAVYRSEHAVADDPVTTAAPATTAAPPAATTTAAPAASTTAAAVAATPPPTAAAAATPPPTAAPAIVVATTPNVTVAAAPADAAAAAAAAATTLLPVTTAAPAAATTTAAPVAVVAANATNATNATNASNMTQNSTATRSLAGGACLATFLVAGSVAHAL